MENSNLERSADNLKSDLHLFIGNAEFANIATHKVGLALASDCDQVINDLILEVERMENEADDITRYTSKISDLEWEIDHLEARIDTLKKDNAELSDEIDTLKQELESI